ncbi:hypothetical protein LV716_09265 [Flagellimonas sp. HMM57]|uniref:hypothetical protein n=1 Tax=unclassified Flagellimonas TaxID=2644544 RepID=UPI0013D2F5AA|nr:MULTISPECIES: hypothetical protein [unclassified Flagellimonas]UII74455.1 hypothetical protein LV716_09265 [Flagellimonas sp. HMM57]
MIEKKDVEKLVLEDKSSTLGTHFRDAFFYNTLKYSGEIRKNEILLWTSSYWLRGGYPIFHLKFNSENKLKGISTVLNPFGKLINKLAIVTTSVFTLIPIVGYGFIDGWKLSVFVLFTAFVLFIILRKVSISEKTIITEELRDVIETLEREKYPEKFKQQEKPKKKEWTLKKTLTRLIFYPVCIVIIYFCLTEILPNGKPTHALFGIGICGAYLIADILNILKK